MYNNITEIKGDAVVDQVFPAVLVHLRIHLEVAVCNNRSVCPRCVVGAGLMVTEAVLSVVEVAAVSTGAAEAEWTADVVALTVVVEAAVLEIAVEEEVSTVVGEWAAEVVLIIEEAIAVDLIVDGVILVAGDLIEAVGDFMPVLGVDIINPNKEATNLTSPNKIINSIISQCINKIHIHNKAMVKWIKIQIQQQSIIRHTISQPTHPSLHIIITNNRHHHPHRRLQSGPSGN